MNRIYNLEALLIGTKQKKIEIRQNFKKCFQKSTTIFQTAKMNRLNAIKLKTKMYENFENASQNI
jgi:hypothetical protein